jgi:MFS family permease
LVGPAASPRDPARDSTALRFDLALQRVSLVILLAVCIAVGLAPSGRVYISLSTLLALGAGCTPAAQAVALELFARQPGRSAAQAGTLFGALAVLSSLVSEVLGPALYGGVYVAAVGVFPPAIWFMNALLIGVSLALLMCVRIQQHTRQVHEA